MRPAYRTVISALAVSALLTACETTPLPDDNEPPTLTIILNNGVGPISSDPEVDEPGCAPRTEIAADGTRTQVEQYYPAGAANAWIGSTYGVSFSLTQENADKLIYPVASRHYPTSMTIIARDNGPISTMTTGFYFDDRPEIEAPVFSADITSNGPDSSSSTNTTIISSYEFTEERFYTSERYPDGIPGALFAYETHPENYDASGEEIPIDGLVLSLDNIENMDGEPTFFVRATDRAGNSTTLEPILIDSSFCADRPS